MATAAVAQTRLDRLVTLLESGSSPAIRATAARQLGQIAAVRVRGSTSSSSTGAKQADGTHTAVPKREEVKEQQSDEEDVKPGTGDRRPSTYAPQPVVEGAGPSSYRGVEGEWDQAVYLIARVLPHLRSKTWDTRMAAAQAIDAICAASGAWDPDLDGGAVATPQDESHTGLEQQLFSFDSFSLSQIFSKGKKLLSSSGNEFDLPVTMSVEERIAHAKRDMQRLGLGSMAGVDMDIGVDMEKELLLSNGDPAVESATTLSPKQAANVPDALTVEVTDEIDMSKLSARERNQLKRKRKLEGKSGGGGDPANKARVVESDRRASIAVANTAANADNADKDDGLKVVTNGAVPHASTSPRPSIDVGASPDPSSTAVNAAEAASLVPPSGQWPFAMVCALLLSDLFSPKWEIRHGAALGLRELLRTQGGAGGKVLGGTVKVEDAAVTNEERHEQWSGDVALRLLCVLTLDRLGDFVFDQVIAPVRETAAQSLASLLKWMSADTVSRVHAILREMIMQNFLIQKLANGDDEYEKDEKPGQSLIRLQAKRGVAGYAWEVRHAGLLGLRYEVTVRDDLLEQDGVLADITRLSIACLRDGDDDVRSVAAKTLLPIIDKIIVKLPGLVPLLLEQLWDGLSSLKDDLSSSTGGVMDLLSRLAERTDLIRTHLPQGDSILAAAPLPRLLPFFRHTITSVRLSVLNALLHFLAVPSLPTDWIDERVVRLTFQNLVVEERPAIREASMAAWNKVLSIFVQRGAVSSLLTPNVDRFFALIMTPLGTPIDYSLFYRASNILASRERHDVDKGILSQDLALVGVDTVIRGRLGAAEALGSIIAIWPEETSQATFFDTLTGYLNSPSALQRCLSAVVIQEWAEHVVKQRGADYDLRANSVLATQLGARLLAVLDNPTPSTYGEMAVMLQRVRRQCQALYSTFARDGKVNKNRVPTLPTEVDTTGTLKDAFTIETAKDAVGKTFDGLCALVAPKAKDVVLPGVQELRVRLIAEIGFYQTIKDRQDSQVAASAAAATIALRNIPAKLNPVIRSVMNSVKFEENADLQRRSARAVAGLIEQLCLRTGGQANPSEKIVKNLCAFVCQDTTQTPVFDNKKDLAEGIVSLNDERSAAGADPTMTEEQREGRNIRRGAEIALEEICNRFGGKVFEMLPGFWTSLCGALLESFPTKAGQDGSMDQAAGQPVVDCCTLLQAVVPHLDVSLQAKIEETLYCLSRAIKCRYGVIRSVSAQTLAVLAESMTEAAMLHIIRDVLPLLGDATNVVCRQGAIETVSFLVRQMDLALLPYVIVLIVPILGRMSDPDESVRLVSTNTFAALVKMVPLEAGLPDPPGLPDELLTKRQDERQFLAQLLDGKKLETYVMPVPINADLRPYQVDGVSWMAFLAKFQLHGALCDDMGVGKTLQSICILASKHFERAERFQQTDSNEYGHLPSLIVCPPTLTGHWVHEIRQYATNLRPLLYAGHPTERTKLQGQIGQYDCIVASYDTVRNDIESLCKHNWLYCILDEGHVIKSAKTKTTRAVKLIKAQHRLILSGTPIQNNVLELWSLFDFLMPGFLGTEKQFTERYGRPILASRDAKVSAKEHERAALALDALHKQVLPFVLRRMKEDVLDDLPPKIIQDISCEMSDVQRQLFDDYMRTQDRDQLNDAAALQDGTPAQQQHVFQTLQYLRKLVCHPLMVFDSHRPRHQEIEQALKRSSGKSIADIANAPKLLALKQLLLDCGIGGRSGGDVNSLSDSGVSQHRVLIFCQQRQMLDIIERDLFRGNMPDVTFARLDGSVASPEKRYAIVQRFNADPSIDVLLLTTSVGGLGLTLTGADTVIFVEHDWNPMKDMQAMDRAHRLGQKKVVNVYRLITKDTLEEQIMGLQRFKLNVAGNIVNQQNKDTDSMQTDQILDLFDVGGGKPAGEEGGKKPAKGISQKALLASLEGMADTGDDYERGGDGGSHWSATN